MVTICLSVWRVCFFYLNFKRYECSHKICVKPLLLNRNTSDQQKSILGPVTSILLSYKVHLVVHRLRMSSVQIEDSRRNHRESYIWGLLSLNIYRISPGNFLRTTREENLPSNRNLIFVFFYTSTLFWYHSLSMCKDPR